MLISSKHYRLLFLLLDILENIKLEIKLRVCSKHSRGNPSTKSEAKVVRKSISDKKQQLDEAVTWYRENNARGQAALKRGKFLLIKDREWLDHKIINGQERQYRTILTNGEECVVTFIKNKNRCMQAVNKKELEKMILDIRKYTNAKFKGGRKYQNLSNNALSAPKNRK